jgi:hypothetical protein
VPVFGGEKIDQPAGSSVNWFQLNIISGRKKNRVHLIRQMGLTDGPMTSVPPAG